MKWVAFLCLLAATTAQAEIYRWRDARGTMHYTNREDEIPARYKSRAVVLNLGLPTAPAPSAPPVAGVSPVPPLPVPPAGSNVSVPEVRPSVPAVSSPRATKRQRLSRERSPHEDE